MMSNLLRECKAYLFIVVLIGFQELKDFVEHKTEEHQELINAVVVYLVPMQVADI
jgi:flagellar biosynthesis/type III secretory pathway ATPase